MAGRPPLELGTAGAVRVYPTRSGDGFRARTLFRDLDGRTRHVERSAKSRGAAQRALAAAIRDRTHASTGGPVIGPTTRLAIAAEVWFDGVREAGRSPSTQQAYRDRLDNQILPALGQIQLRELTVSLVDRHLRAVQTRNGNATAKQTKSVLSGICGLAVRYDALKANPCRDATRISSKPRRPPQAMSIDQIRTFLAWLAQDETARRHDLHDLVAFMVATGLRLGEALAVTWNDIDLDQGTVTVHGTLLRIKGEGLQVKASPKTVAGERTLQLPTWAVTMLRGRAANLERPVTGSDPVLPDSATGFRDRSNTGRALRNAFRATGHAGLSSHTFRKTVATLMDEAGLSARQAADQLGHAKPSMTADIYYGRQSRATGAATVLEELL